MSTSPRAVRPRVKGSGEAGENDSESPVEEQAGTALNLQVESAAHSREDRFDKIARRAHELFESRGREHGRDLDDWFQAEQEIGNQPASG